ncbi:MAG: DUF3137 domain-containing protein [Maricaulaceae bacterium]|jgi:hypothetical protein
MTETREPFEEFFPRIVAPALAAKEAEREQAVRWFIAAVAVGGVLALLVVLATFARGAPSPAAGFIAFVALAGGVGVGFGILAAFATGVKDVLLPLIARYAGVSFKRYVPDVSSIRRFVEHGLLPTYDRSSFEDFLSGFRADCPFELFEAHLKKRRTDSKGRTRYTTCFRGQLLRVLVPMEFLGTTVVLRDAGLFNVFIKPKGELKRVGLVDPKFEKTFEVFGSDQVEARYLLTPDFMERLLHLEELLKGKKARAAFDDGELLIAIEGGNLFEPGSMFKPLADEARARKVLEEIETVQGVIDALLAAQAGRGAPSGGDGWTKPWEGVDPPRDQP